MKNITDCVIRKGVFGSDHCPLVLGLSTLADNTATGQTGSEDGKKEVSEGGSGASVDRSQGEGVHPVDADVAEGKGVSDNEGAEVLGQEE